MKKYMAIFTGTPAAFESWTMLDEKTRKSREAEGMQAWQQWAEKHHGVTVDHGGPLGKTKRTTADGIADIRNNLAGYTIISAESHDAAAKLFEKHPHFSIFPGDGVEIMEVLPVPGM